MLMAKLLSVIDSILVQIMIYHPSNKFKSAQKHKAIIIYDSRYTTNRRSKYIPYHHLTIYTLPFIKEYKFLHLQLKILIPNFLYQKWTKRFLSDGKTSFKTFLEHSELDSLRITNVYIPFDTLDILVFLNIKLVL
jgi:hypothetical protein